MVKKKTGFCENVNDEANRQTTSTIQIICNFTSFLVITFITIGELLTEENLRGVLIFGGGLTILNIFLTLADCERMRWEEVNIHQNTVTKTKNHHSKHHDPTKNGEYVSINIEPDLVRKRKPRGTRGVYFQDEEPDTTGLDHALEGTEKKKKSKSKKKRREKETRSREQDRKEERINTDYEQGPRQQKSRKNSQKIAGSRSSINKETKSRERVRRKKKKRESRRKRVENLHVEHI